MSYIDDSLIEGESVLHRARISWWSQAGLVVLGIVLLVAVIGIFFLVAAWIRVRSTEIAITNRRVIAKFGFIRRNTVEINLEKVEALRVEQGMMGRMLNYGTVFISGAGTSVAPIPDIADPLVFRRKFMEATNRPISMPHRGMG
ncbi:MAG TPA: PH domain-containing protein [Usitatibacter sp.]|nr:PH domain-containing protein [Usitatibacter sp.]